MGLRQQAGKTPEEISERLDRYCAVAEALRGDEELWNSLPAESRRFRDPLGILYEDAAAVAEEADILEGESVEEYYHRIEPAILAAIQAYIDDAAETYGVPQAYQERAERTVNGPLEVQEKELALCSYCEKMVYVGSDAADQKVYDRIDGTLDYIAIAHRRCIPAHELAQWEVREFDDEINVTRSIRITDDLGYGVEDSFDDAEALASAGMGTDEDYGYYGEEA